MELCWAMEPTSDRIIADIEDLEPVLDKIIDAKGCVVPEINLRYGHRLISHNGGRVLTRKVTQRQRKHFLQLGPVHPDAEDALRILLSNEPAVALGADELAEVEQVVEQALAELGESENDPYGSDSDSGD